jgi:tRNA (guanine-N7-)-methyltransferase
VGEDRPRSEAAIDPSERSYRFYGRRTGRRLRAGRQKLLDELLPQFRIVAPGNPDGQAPSLQDPGALFGSAKDALWLEIGFGGGEHLAWQAEHYPQVGFLGAEPYINGTASLIGHLERGHLKNVRIWPDDVRPLLDALPDNCLDRVFILHPDPWPKTRHAGRRIVNPASLDQLSRLMRDCAELRIASDHPLTVSWVLFQLGRRADFEWTARRPDDWRQPVADWPVTRYEEKSRAEGRVPAYLRFRRRPRG